MDLQDSKIAQAKTEHELLMEDPRSARSAKRADKRRRRKYKFSDKTHPKAGIISTGLIVPGIVFVVLAVSTAASMKGHAGPIVGILPFLSLLTSTAGIILAAVTFRRPDTIYTFSWTGLIGNLIIWLTVAFMMASGL